MQYLMAIDQGTTSTTVVIIDETLRLCSSATREYPQVYPQPDWVEHNPDDIWQSVLEAIGEAVAKARIDAANIAALGITNQRETTVVWDRKTGTPVYNAIVWQCRRTSPFCDRLRKEGLEETISEKTGLIIDPYFSASKIRWILDHKNLQQAAVNGELCFGTIDTYLLWQLTGGKAHCTDASNASRTQLMNLKTREWDEDLLKIFDVPKIMLPKICNNAGILGRTWNVPGLPNGIPIAGMAGDQQAALFGQICFEPGEAKCTFGTGSFLLMNTGENIVRSKHGLLSTLAWSLDGKTTYALEGSTFIAGALVQWLRDGLRIIRSAAEVEELALTVPDAGGVIIVPSFTGLGSPHWKPNARGLIWGLTRSTTRGHIARAALEGICQQNTDLLEAMSNDLLSDLKSLKVDGGASADNLLMQLQADLLCCPLHRPEILQTTALGAAMLAGLGVGLFADLDELKKSWKIDQIFEPRMSAEDRAISRNRWLKAIEKTEL